VSADRDANGRAINMLCDAGPGAAPQSCDTATPVFLGQPFAKVDGAVTTTVAIGRLQLYGMVDFKRGGKLLNTTPLLQCAILGGAEINVFPERFSAPRVGECQSVLSALGTSLIQDASYVKLRELAVSYDLQPRWARALGASRASLTLGARNLHTWTGFEGLDPETFTVGNWLRSNHTESVLPLPAQIVGTVSLTF